MKKILFTGGAGFIGSNFIRKALFEKSNYSFVSIDACNDTNVLNSVYANKGHKFYIGNLKDQHFTNIIFEIEKPDYVIHAACSKQIEDIYSTQSVINSCRKYNVEKLLFLSDYKVQDVTVYPSAIKLAEESLIVASGYEDHIKHNILRLSNVYGPRQKNGFISYCIKNLLQNKSIDLYGDGFILREWTHVDDIYTAVILILENGIKNSMYNVSSNHTFSKLEIVNELFNIANKKTVINFIDKPKKSKLIVESNSFELKKFNWKPSSFKECLENTFFWFDKNRWILKD